MFSERTGGHADPFGIAYRDRRQDECPKSLCETLLSGLIYVPDLPPDWLNQHFYRSDRMPPAGAEKEYSPLLAEGKAEKKLPRTL